MPEFAEITAEEFARSTGTERDSDNSAVLTPQQSVRKILAEEDGSVFEKRVQAIAFLSEVSWIVKNDAGEESVPPLTSAEYHRAARGVFSPQVREVLGEIEHVYSRVAYTQGNRTRKYNTSKVRDPAGGVEPSNGDESDAYATIKDNVGFADKYSDETLMRVCLTLDDVEGLETGESIDLEHVSDTI